MLFPIDNRTPKFQVFEVLNQELLGFIERAVPDGEFDRTLFSRGGIGQACWDNTKDNNARAEKNLTRDKFGLVFGEIQKLTVVNRRELHDIFVNNQDLFLFFQNPNVDMFAGFPLELIARLKSLTSHLYTATKDLNPIVNEAGGGNIRAHFTRFKRINGNVCKACGMQQLGAIRANVSDQNQWRSDYDHQLCKSEYPIYAVHPENLIPICDVCNQDAKKAKDLFKDKDGNIRSSFYKNESGVALVDIEMTNLHDPEPSIDIEWLTQDQDLISKLECWDDIYEVKKLVLGKFSNMSAVIIDEINPIDINHLITQISDRAREPNGLTYKRKAWAFWDYKFFSQLHMLDLADLQALWESINFELDQGAEGGESILQGA
ncbi:MAG: hypothetical protein RPS47_13565 [Colwellia sp.]|jgi:hypothetical protein